MSKDIGLTNSKLSAVHFVPLDGWKKVFKTHDFLFFTYFKLYRSTSTEWILYFNVGCWHLSGKDSGSNPSGMTQVYPYDIRMQDSIH